MEMESSKGRTDEDGSIPCSAEKCIECPWGYMESRTYLTPAFFILSAGRQYCDGGMAEWNLSGVPVFRLD